MSQEGQNRHKMVMLRVEGFALPELWGSCWYRHEKSFDTQCMWSLLVYQSTYICAPTLPWPLWLACSLTQALLTKRWATDLMWRKVSWTISPVPAVGSLDLKVPHRQPTTPLTSELMMKTECPSSWSHNWKTHTMASSGIPGSNITNTLLTGPTIYWKSQVLQLLRRFYHTPQQAIWQGGVYFLYASTPKMKVLFAASIVCWSRWKSCTSPIILQSLIWAPNYPYTDHPRTFHWPTKHKAWWCRLPSWVTAGKGRHCN